MFLTSKVKTKKIDSLLYTLYRDEKDGKVDSYTLVGQGFRQQTFKVKTNKTAILKAVYFLENFVSCHNCEKRFDKKFSVSIFNNVCSQKCFREIAS